MATNMIGGGNFIFTGFRSYRATMYLGLGGGVARLKVATPAVPSGYYRTRLMADTLMGLELKLVPGISLFVEPYYVWTTRMLNGMSTHVGLAFHYDRFKAVPQMRPAPPVYIRSETVVPKAPEPLMNKPQASSAEALATMQEMIYFQNDSSDLSDSARAILNDKVAIFRANPAMRIIIVGLASQSGTEAYNLALGLRRAEAAKTCLVSQGVDPIRIEISTLGEGQLAVEGPGEVVNAQNRRNQFRLLIADPYLAAPKK